MEKKDIHLASWNVNGIRAAMRKGFLDWLEQSKFDIVCVQETKVSDTSLVPDELQFSDNYESYWNCSTEKKGYSGVAVYTRLKPSKVTTYFGNNILSAEGRMIRLDFKDFTLLNVYFPNGGAGPVRLQYKLDFYKAFLAYVKRLIKTQKNIVFCGDVNTAHQAIDLARPKENINSSGFLEIEREWLDKFEQAGFIDSFRLFNKQPNHYTWWDYKTRARERNVGWRIDYFYISKFFKKHVKYATIMPELIGSDHCPVTLHLQ